MKTALQTDRSGMASEPVEGLAKLSLASPGVFYNPRMNLARDLAVLFAASFFSKDKRVRVCDAMTGSGVRAARYMLECPNVESVVAADTNPEAVAATRRTVRLNGLENAVTVIESDANLLLHEQIQNRFDLVDLDPFGSPAPYLESALRATEDGGILAATATDMAPLTGARPAACFRKYGARPIRTEFGKEMAVRILAGCLAGIAGRLELGVEVLFVHASDHYARIYAAVRKGKTSANASANQLGFLGYCPKCLARNPIKSLATIELRCTNCGAQLENGGPIWLGELWDRTAAQSMIERTPALLSSRLSEIQLILSRVLDEVDNPAFYFRTDAFAQSLRIRPLGIAHILEALQKRGDKASRTHFDRLGFRTDMEIGKLRKLLRDLAPES